MGTASRSAYEIFAMMYHTVGAMNEKLAMTAYQTMARVAVEMGEQELADVLFSPMRRDESMHLGYYRTDLHHITHRIFRSRSKGTGRASVGSRE